MIPVAARTQEPVSDVAIDLTEDFGWSCWRLGGTNVWFKGYLNAGAATFAGQTAAERIHEALDRATNEQVPDILRSLAGHFAFVLHGERRTIAAVDKIRSIPIAFTNEGSRLRIDHRPHRLLAGLQRPLTPNPDGVIAVAMAGYTIGADTLYQELHLLRAGEALICDGGTIEQKRYYSYRAWEPARDASPDTLTRQLRETLLECLERLAEIGRTRPILIPLSAGYDSRAIVSGLSHLGCRNVKCFAYGRPGNFEAEASREIAERLGYEWTFVPFTHALQHATFNGTLHKEAFFFRDSCAGVPFEQDFIAIRELKDNGYIPADAVIVNGQSGDFITGNHIVPALLQPQPANPAARERNILSALIEKHFSLWRALKTRENVAHIESLLRREIALAGITISDAAHDYGVYEFAEYQDRQAKYLTNGQRIYEFFGLDWRWPLWDDELILFFQNAPLWAKARQKLYRDVLHDENWGGVWQGASYPKRTRPAWLAAARFAAKLAIAPFGRDRWRDFERRFVSYWTDNLCVSSVVSYREVASDTRGARHALAWLAEDYLHRHNAGIHPLVSEKESRRGN